MIRSALSVPKRTPRGLQEAVEAPRLHTEGGDVLVSTFNIRVTPNGLEAGVEQFGMAWAAGH